MRRALLVLLISLPLWGCEPRVLPAERRPIASPAVSVSSHVSKIAPLIDPGKLATLSGKRAATPRLRKACYWLEMARRDGHDLAEIIDQGHAATGHDSANREAEQSAALIRNVTILERFSIWSSCRKSSISGKATRSRNAKSSLPGGGMEWDCSATKVFALSPRPTQRNVASSGLSNH